MTQFLRLLAGSVGGGQYCGCHVPASGGFRDAERVNESP